MKKLFVMAAIFATSGCTVAKTDPLAFKTKGQSMELSMLDGREVKYTAYLNIPYVTNVEDENYQTLNFFVPEGATQKSPILLRTYVGGYMAAAAKNPSATDATGRALAEGMCVCIPGARGNNSMQGDVYTGIRTVPRAFEILPAINTWDTENGMLPRSLMVCSAQILTLTVIR